MKFECLRAIISYRERYPLALSAASPQARMAVELYGEYKCGVFTVMIGDEKKHRCVTVNVYSLIYKGRLYKDEETIMDWWLMRRETRWPINFEVSGPEMDLEDGKTPQRSVCNIHLSAMLPIVRKMLISYSAGSLSWVDACTSMESLEAAACCHPISFRSFHSLACLTVLDVSKSDVHSFEGISGCVNLEVLDVSECTGTGNYSPIGRCTRLQRLSMNKCKTIRDFSWIGQLNSLTYLFIRYVKLANMGWIAGCTSLDTLCMAGSRCEDYHPIAKLKTLRSLEWHGKGVSSMQWTRDMHSLESMSFGVYAFNRLHVNRRDYPDAKTWCDVLQACGAFKRRNSSSDRFEDEEDEEDEDEDEEDGSDYDEEEGWREFFDRVSLW